MALQFSSFNDDRAVSPVIGVILMVAITVILAAVIGAFVLDLGSNQSENANAGVSIEQQSSDTVRVQITDIGNADNVRVETDGGSIPGGDTMSSVGSTVTVNGLGTDDTVTVIAVNGDSENVIRTYTHE
ncbi:type IV pilin [Halostella litorea]|uniref:type IV pilin n=1 Tax=Halostella litorea TaxID=2528831 RepID=UPI001091A512|nr:type IV pilin N-terminal domain-containing protein [Halostella litorea]